MNAFDVLLGKKLAGSSGGGGDVDNLLTSTIEIGTIDQNGANSDNPNRLRTKDFTTLSAGDFSLFFTAASNIYCMMFRYAADGTFIDRSGGGTFASPPISFTAQEGQKFRFAFSTQTSGGSTPMEPSDVHNLILVAK